MAAGARWREVIAALDPLGFLPAVMQSNHDFGVAAPWVNAHGWPGPGPFGSTVRAFRLMLADGTLVAARPARTPTFRPRHGRLWVVGDRYRPRGRHDRQRALGDHSSACLRPSWARAWCQRCDAAVIMAYGRLSIDAKDFLRTPCRLLSAGPAAARALPLATARRPTPVPRGVPRADRIRTRPSARAGTPRRWPGPKTSSGVCLSRATGLLNEPVANLAGRDPRAHGHPARILPCRPRVSSPSWLHAVPPIPGSASGPASTSPCATCRPIPPACWPTRGRASRLAAVMLFLAADDEGGRGRHGHADARG